MGSIRKCVFITLTILFWSQMVLCQQTPLFSEYSYNPFVINPAYAGMKESADVTVNNHGYLPRIEGSPKNMSLSFDMPLAQRKIGVGAVLSQDKIGITTNFSAYAALSYKIFFGAKNNRSYIRTPNWRIYNTKVFSFGMTAGVRHLKEDLLELGIDNDPEFSENIRALTSIVGAGFIYNTANIYVGVSAPNLLSNKFIQDQVSISNPIYGYWGYRCVLGSYEDIMLKPSMLIKYEEGAPLQVDVNFSTNFRDRLEIGVGYRSTSSLNLMAGIYLLDHLRFVYHYNTRFKYSVMGNSHGMTLSYSFDSTW